jgi:hypothetical protein
MYMDSIVYTLCLCIVLLILSASVDNFNSVTL